MREVVIDFNSEDELDALRVFLVYHAKEYESGHNNDGDFYLILLREWLDEGLTIQKEKVKYIFKYEK